MIIGIDLGTTNSLAAFFGSNGPEIIPNRLGNRFTPSIVSIDDEGNLYVGETARERMLLYPDSSRSVFKRDMGSDKKYTLGDKEYRAEELSSFILRSLKEDAEAFLGEPVTEAVVSVPAYFNDARRKATKRAGELAGLTVNRIISEPTAAAIAYGLYHLSENTKILVFDLGGGTFDISIIELYHNILEVRAVSGDNYLGGENFTNVLDKLFCEKHKLDRDALDNRTAALLHKQAELAKIALSAGRDYTMTCSIAGIQMTYTPKISEYENACEELLEKIRIPIRKSLADAKIKLPDIDMVILVGGATKLPMIRSFVSKTFNQFPNTSVNPDEAVALGAAIQAAMKERNESIKEIILTDVCSFTLGTEVVVERENKLFEDGHFCPIIERNTVIPASRTERLYTLRDNQTQIRVNVLQGESRFAKNNLSLGELSISVPAAKAGQESVDVTYTYDINSILEVEVTVVSTGKKHRKIFNSRNLDMNDTEIAERIQELSYLKIRPRDQEQNKMCLLKAERLYEESTGTQRTLIENALRKFETCMDTQDPVIISNGRKEIMNFLDEIEEV
jgi:molecular chaperone HscC